MITKQTYLISHEYITSKSDLNNSLAKVLISHKLLVSKLKEHKLHQIQKIVRAAERYSVSGLPLADFQSKRKYFVLEKLIHRSSFLNSVLISLMNTEIICYWSIWVKSDNLTPLDFVALYNMTNTFSK